MAGAHLYALLVSRPTAPPWDPFPYSPTRVCAPPARILGSPGRPAPPRAARLPRGHLGTGRAGRPPPSNR